LRLILWHNILLMANDPAGNGSGPGAGPGVQIADGIQVQVIRTPNWLHYPATRHGAFQDAGKNTPGQNTGKKQTQETGFVTGRFRVKIYGKDQEC
jgi:hypothetical protein